jgi:hypothetical protein
MAQVYDYDKKPSIDIKSLKIDVATLPVGLRETTRMLCKFIVIDPYLIDNDIAITFYYKQDNTGLEKELSYNVSKDEQRFKQKLPKGINAREFWVRVYGSNLTVAEIGKISVLWIPRRIGDR